MAKSEQSKQIEQPLTKGDVTRTPGSPTDRVQMLAEGWQPADAKTAPKAPSRTDPKS